MSERPKVVLITGASTGIGRAVALEMRGRGWRVFATVRKSSDVVDLTKVGRGLIEPLIMDVTDEESVKQAVATVQERSGRLDAVVNNAGVAVSGPIEQLTTEDLQKQFDINLFGVHRVTRACLPMLRASKGRIVQISSVSGRVTLPFTGAYAASKYALEAYSDALRMELAGSGVKVIVIQPGSIQTPIWDKSAGSADILQYASEHYPEQELQRLARYFLKTGRAGLPVERVSVSVADALELPWPLHRWMIIPAPWGIHLIQWLPSFITDRLKLMSLHWPPRRK